MKKAALLLLAGALLACNRQRTWSAAPEQPGSPTETGTWVATPADLQPEQVRLVQRALGDRGFSIELSGRYDDQTRTAVGDFQRSRGLAATGNLNAETAAALGLDPAEVMPVRGTTPSAARAPDGAR